MRVLVLGSGGREHALCWAIAGSPLLTRLWCVPGNPGIAQMADCLAIDDVPGLVRFAQQQEIDLVVPGPEKVLVAGVADAMAAAGICCCGPTTAAAQLEASKRFGKEVCDAAGIPTARWAAFDDPTAAAAYIHERAIPQVVKADGLAAGKGVIVCDTEAEAQAAVEQILVQRQFGDAGMSVVIEDRLAGEEVSLFALCDGYTALNLGAAQDHKRVAEGDRGPNTGGMGAYSPPPRFTQLHQLLAMQRFILPALSELVRRGTPYRGVLYAGLMLTDDGMKLIEFNVRFGDPECQALVLRMKSDLLPVLCAACDGELENFDFQWKDTASIAVVLAARGYPEAPEYGSEIRGINRADTQVFHAGTTLSRGRLLATGGRVLTVCASGANLAVAQRSAYAAIDRIDWPEGFCRRDIGWRALT